MLQRIRQTIRWSDALAIVAALGVIAWTASVRSSGLDPQTLWADDVWVGSMTKLPLATAMTLPAPVPPLFIAMLSGMRAAIDDPELSLQLLPFVFGLLGPLLLGAVAAVVTRSAALGVVAVCLAVVSPFLAHYSIFVKQYTFDFAMAAALLLMAAMVLRGRGPGLIATAVTSFVAAACSLPSVFISVPLVHLQALAIVQRRWRDRRAMARTVGAVVAFDAALAVLYATLLSGRRNPALMASWRGDFLPLTSIGDALDFVVMNGGGALATAVPEGWILLLLLPLAGLPSWLFRREWRMFGALVVLSYLGVLTASGLGLLPIGTEFRARPVLFSHAMTLLLIVAGVDALRRVTPRPGWVAAAVAVVAVALAVWRPTRVEYFPLDHSTFVRRLEVQAGTADAIVLNLPAAYLTGYYGRWPVGAVLDTSPQGFAIELQRPRSLTLPRGEEEGAAPSPTLDEFLRRERPVRAFFLSSRRGIEAVEATFAAHGYVQTERLTSRVSTVLATYVRQ